ncbi:hypothetical protein ACCT18_01165 [Rhizobium ruizarguesonis]
MTYPIDPALYADLFAKHGTRMPAESEVFLRPGWVPLVDRLLTDIAREYPDARIVGLVGCGWLQIDTSLPTNGDHDWTRHVKFDRWLQRYVTESLWTCECCGSHHGRDRLNRRVLCEDCQNSKESCDAHA